MKRIELKDIGETILDLSHIRTISKNERKYFFIFLEGNEKLLPRYYCECERDKDYKRLADAIKAR